jgi:hypothetical protein
MIYGSIIPITFGRKSEPLFKRCAEALSLALTRALIGLTRTESRQDCFFVPECLTIDCVFAELMQGAKSPRELHSFLKCGKVFPKVDEAGLLLQAGEMADCNDGQNVGLDLLAPGLW